MNWGGVIAGALGSAGAAAVDFSKNEQAQQQKLDLLRVQADIDKEKAAYIAEMGERIRREGMLYDTKGEGGQAKLSYEVERTNKVGAAETSVLTQRERDLAPIKQTNEVSRAEAVKRAEGRVDRENAAAYATDPNARAGTRAQARDKHVESAASAASAALHEFDLKQRKEMAQVLEQIDQEPDPEKKAKLEDKFKRLSGGKYASRYEAVKVKNAEGEEVTQILDKQTGYTDAPRTAPSAGKRYPEPPPGAIEDLKKSPATKAQFEAVFGPGSADKVLKSSPATGAAPAPSALTPQEKAAADKAAADRQKKQEWDAQVKAREKASQDQLRTEISGLTPDQIRALSSTRAQEFLTKYNAVLSSEQRRALNKQL